MAYELKVKNGKVKALLKTGKDFVATEMNETGVRQIISHGKLKESGLEDYPISVNGEWFFAGSIEKEEPEEKPAKGKKKK